MATFHYTGRDAEGAPVSGKLDASSSDAAAADLFGRRITPVDIKLQKDSGGKAAVRSPGGPQLSFIDRANAFLGGSKVELTDLIVFARQMYSLTKAGLPLDRALSGLEASMKHEGFRKVLRDVHKGLENGMSLASSMSRHPRVFSPLFLSLVNVGENTGQLDTAFEQIAKYLTLEKETRKQIKSATRYPSFVLATIAVALAVITYFVIPAFSETFARLNAELPLETRLLIGISDFVVNYWALMLGIIVAAIFGFRYYVRTEKGLLNWDRQRLRFPLVGSIFERIALARFARTFSMVLRAGVPVVQGLTVVAEAVGNQHIAGHVRRMRESISRGESLHIAASSSKMFSPLVLQMISVGEESGTVDDLLAEVADFYDVEVEFDLKRLSETIEPILIMVIAAMVLVLALGVFLPIWDLNSAVN